MRVSVVLLMVLQVCICTSDNLRKASGTFVVFPIVGCIPFLPAEDILILPLL